DRTWSNREFSLMVLKCMELNRHDFEACIVIARYAGLRIHEAMKIDTATARNALKNDFITIKGKGGKVRDVPINESIRIVLKNSLEQTAQGEKLFVPKNKQTHEVIKELQTFIATHRKSVQDEGSTRPMTFHGLRHTCAAEWFKRLIAEGRTEYQARLQVSRWLGHERDDVTNIYLASINKDEEEGGDV
ncbi:MAG: site-specific integrase, partial [Oscillospiraceae bacterium]|nr:site-specific integrase [Oscillospiraceae bacterium]